MATYYRKEELGDPYAMQRLDLLWAMQPDGTGIPKDSDDPGKLTARINKSPGSREHLTDGLLKIETARNVSNIEMKAFTGGTARLELNGDITINDPTLVIE